MGLIVFYVLLMLVVIIATWRMFEKAGQPGWAIFIPIYNIIVMLNVAKKPWWWLFLLMIPVVNFIVLIMMYNGISKNFGKSEGFTVGLVLLNPIFIMILGFGSAKYIEQKNQE